MKFFRCRRFPAAVLLAAAAATLAAATPLAAASSKFDNSLRYSSKESQASPGLYFDPESGTFRERPPDPKVMRALGGRKVGNPPANVGDKEHERYFFYIPE